MASAAEGYPFVPPEWAPSVFVPLTGLVLPAVAMATLFTYIEKVRRNFSSSGNRKYGGGDGVGGGDFDRGDADDGHADSPARSCTATAVALHEFCSVPLACPAPACANKLEY